MINESVSDTLINDLSKTYGSLSDISVQAFKNGVPLLWSFLSDSKLHTVYTISGNPLDGDYEAYVMESNIETFYRFSNNKMPLYFYLDSGMQKQHLSYSLSMNELSLEHIDSYLMENMPGDNVFAYNFS